jgi:hypothetical protein
MDRRPTWMQLRNPLDYMLLGVHVVVGSFAIGIILIYAGWVAVIDWIGL